MSVANFASSIPRSIGYGADEEIETKVATNKLPS